jgi:glucokinase
MAIIGVDLAGTFVTLGRIDNLHLEKVISAQIDHNADKFFILENICDLISKVFSNDIDGIGFGVPSVVDVKRGIVYDVKNIPSWKRIHLKEHLEKKFKVPVYLNNDANCFAVGEKYFGKTKKSVNSIGLILGQGVGSGVIINNKLYSGNNCMAGEFGKIPYKDYTIEHYCSEAFFKTYYDLSSDEVFKKCLEGDEKALNIFEEFGTHLGNAIKTILYSVDPDIIVIGEFLSKYFDLYESAMWESIRDFVFPQSLKNLRIEVSETKQISVMGAAALYLDATA